MAYLKDGRSRFEVVVSSAIKARAKRICKDLGISFAQLAKDALVERIVWLEDKQRRAEAEARAAKEANEGEKPRFRSFKKLSMPLGGSRLAEIAKPSPLGTQGVAVEEVKELPVEYVQHARRVSEADSPYERRLRMDEAVAAIKKRAPLSHPAESAIREELEKLTETLRDAVASEMDPMVGKTISPEVLARVKTSRSPDVGEGEDEDR